MGKHRLEAFSDGVIAILITIMVLELCVPHGTDFLALRGILPIFLTYVLSFIFLGIYWSNHHHMFQLTPEVNGAILWANLHLLFWLSLVPFVTRWMGENHWASVPTAVYGTVLFMASIAYYILVRVIIASQGAGSKLKAAVGKEKKGMISSLLYLVAIGLAFVHQFFADAIYILVALMWLVSDRRIEKKLAAKRG